MASELLYLVFLFMITFAGSHALEDNAATKTKAGLVLVPGPFRVDAYPSAPLRLDCNVEVSDQSLLPLTYTWYKEGRVVASKRAQILQNGSLYLEPYKKVHRQRLHDGLYECMVTTALGETALTRQVDVVFAKINKSYTSNPKATEAFEGGAVRFWCDIYADPSANIQWIKDNTNVLNNDRYTILPGGILQISPVRASDAGLYWCNSRFNLELDKFAKIKTSEKASLTVRKGPNTRPPKLLGPPQNFEVEIGKPAFFECLADGNPLPNVEWRKRGSPDKISDGRLFGRNNLMIPRVTLADAGIYDCVVIGSKGSFINISATLTVITPPKLVEDTPSYVLPVARSKSIFCRVTGNPEPQIQWLYNGRRIDDSRESNSKKVKDGGQRLILYSLRKTDAGYYQCIASNPAGVVISVSRIELKNKGTAPDRPKNVTAKALSSTSILVSVQFSPITEFSLIQYQAEGEVFQDVSNIVGRDRNAVYSRKLGELKPYTNYSVEVQALTTKNGASDYSEKIYVLTMEDVPTDSPSLSLTNPNYHTILVSWTPLTPEQSRGKVVKYRIFFKAEDALEVYEDVPADQTSFYIRDVEPETTYYIQVLAGTKAGYSKRDSTEAMKHVTPAVNASSPPRLSLRYINKTSVMLSWQSPASLSTEDRVIGYNFNITNLSDDSEKVPFKHFSVNASVHSQNVSNLNSFHEYEVTLMAVMKMSYSGTSSRKFQLNTLRLQPEQWHFSVADITAHNISLVWMPVASEKVEYEVCCSKEESNVQGICNRMFETSWTVKNLDPFTRYLFKAKALLADENETFTKNLIVQTREDLPTPPVKLIAEVLKPRVVHLRWLPPLLKNGELKAYIVKYARQDKDSSEDMTWKSITQKATSTSAEIDGLKIGKYLFRVLAVNSVGQSKPSQTVSAVPVCLEESELSCEVEVIPVEEPKPVEIPWSKKASLPAKAIWIIVAFVGFIVMIVIGVIIFCLYKRRSRQQPGDMSLNSSHTPFFPGNGHISSGHPQHHQHAGQGQHLIPRNGHAGAPPGVGYGPGDVISPQEYAPMLNQMVENTHLDSKGGSDPIIPNGFYHNGLIRPNNKPVSFELQNKKYNHSPEEYQGLMLAMMDSNGLKKSLMNSPVTRAGEDFQAQSPASSSGESSLEHQGNSQIWEHRDSSAGHVDEIGGHLIDRTTDAVIGPDGDGSQRRNKGRSDGVGMKDVDLVIAKGGDQGGLMHGETFFEEEIDDGNASNDRDSGHGGEVKSQQGAGSGMTDSGMTDSGHAELLTSDIDSPPHQPSSSVVPGDPLCQFSGHCLSSSSSPLPQQAAASSPSLVLQPQQQQLPLSNRSNALSSPDTSTHSQHSGNNHHHQHRRANLRSLRQQPHIDLPLPPPPPPPPQSPPSPTNSTSSATTITTAASAAAIVSASEHAPKADNTISDSTSGVIKEAGQQGCGNGSRGVPPRQSQGNMDVAFSPPRPPPSPPNIA